MAGTDQRKIFASPHGAATPKHGAATPNAILTQSKAPNPHGTVTSTHPEHTLRTARRQTRMPGRHQHAIFASPHGAATPKHGAATPNAILTQSKAPNPHGTVTSTHPEHTLRAARRQTRMPGRHQHTIFASPHGAATPKHGAATPNTIYTKQSAKPAWHRDINTPQTHFTHRKARKKSTRNFRISTWHSYPEHTLHTARRQTRMPGRHQRAIFASLRGRATPNTIYTQQSAKPACREDINTQFLHLDTAPATQTEAVAQRRPGTPQHLSGGSGDRACHATEAAASCDQARRSTSLEALETAPATQTEAAASGAAAPLWRLWRLRLPHKQKPRASGDQAER